MTTHRPGTICDADFRALADAVRRHCGIDLHEGKRDLVHARVARQVRARGFASAGDYLRRALADPPGREFAALVDALSTNLTSFFREGDHFHFLAERFLPALLRHKRRRGSNRLRGWSAACSTGEEAYSLGMTVLDVLDRRGGGASGWDVKLLATDLSARVLRTAAAGAYGPERAADVPPALRAKYLAASRVGARDIYEVRPAVRDVVRFRHLNLMDPWPFRGPFDFIFCRNVMIYFDKPTQQKLVNRLWDLLEPGGLLFTGHSESLGVIPNRFKYVEPTIYARP